MDAVFCGGSPVNEEACACGLAVNEEVNEEACACGLAANEEVNEEACACGLAVKRLGERPEMKDVGEFAPPRFAYSDDNWQKAKAQAVGQGILEDVRTNVG